MAEYPTFVHLDRGQLRTLTHPLRLRLLAALRLDGPSTATTLAQRLGSNMGKTSYPLPKLATVNLVVEDLDRGNARNRWSRAAHDVTSWSPADVVDDAEAAAAGDWLLGEVRLIGWMAGGGDV